ncbi:MAG: translocation/assembly module TamB domain-containing protein [Chromatiales bacterium]|nr:translocation/assembly module TamB domain-containing protein [Chromatiales bacterium]
MKRRLPPLSLMFLLLLGLGLTWVLHSSAALRWGFSLASENLPLTIEASSLDGSLAGPMQIRGLNIVSADITVTAQDLELDWWAGDLLRGRVNLKHLNARELVITRLESTEAGQQAKSEPGSLALPELPVSLSLKNLTIDGLSFVSNGSAVRLLERFRGAASWNSRAIIIKVDELQRTDVSLSKSHLQIEGQLPHKLSGTVEWNIPGLLSEELLGRSELGGVLAKPYIRSKLLQPAPASLELSMDLALPTPLIEGMLDAQKLNLSALQDSWPDQSLTAAMGFSIDGRAISAQGTLQWAELPGVDIALQSIIEADHIQLQALDIRAQGTSGKILAAGTIPLSAEQAFHLTAQWNDLDLATAGKQLRSAGTASMSGTPSAYTLQVSTDSQIDDYPEITLQASATGSEKGLLITGFLAEVMNGSVVGNAELDWQDGLRAGGHINAAGLDSSTLDASFPGRIPPGVLNLEAGLGLAMDETGTRLTVDLEKLSGEIGGEKLSGQGSMTLNPEQLKLEALELRLGKGTITASGTLAENLDFQVQVTTMRVTGWLPALDGTLAAELALSGPLESPTVEGFVSAEQPSFGDWRGGVIEAQLSANLATQVASSLSLQARGLHNAGHLLGDLDVQVQGIAESHELTLTLTGGEQELLAQARGGYQAEPGWIGEISRLELIPSSAFPAPWVLAAATPLKIGATDYHLGNLCLDQEKAHACLSGKLVDGAGDVELQASQLPLSILNPLLGSTLDVSGLLNGKLQGQFNQRGELTGQVQLEIDESNINWYRSGADLVSVSIVTARLNGSATQEGIDLKAMLDLGEQDSIQLALNMERSPGPATAWPARGWVSVDLSDLSRYDTVVSGLEELTGKLSSRLDLSGSLDEPLTSGHLSLENMETYLPGVGTRISAVSVDLKNQNQSTQLVASATIGSGQVALSGDVALLQGKPRADLRLTGDGLTLVDSQNLYLQASPDLSLTLDGEDVNITGKLYVPLARIRPVELSSALRSSPDAVVLNSEGSREDRGRFKVTTKVMLELGNRVKFDGYGLTANVTGFLELSDVPGKITTGRGELNVVKGKYKLYGMALEVERGQLLFAGGPIDTPGLSIRAARETDNVRVGVDVGGTLSEPTLTMFSSPSMPQSEIVAYLLTGKPMTDLDSASGQRASAAGDALALAGGNLLTGEIGARVGLDEVALSSDIDTGNEELVLGKHLSPDLYVSYGIGLYEAINTLRIRYQINERLSLRSESGVTKSLDIFWSAER